MGQAGRNISVKIVAILVVSLLVVELVILVFSAFSEYERLVGHYRFEGEVIARAVDPARLEDRAYRDELLSRLSEMDVQDIEAAPRQQQVAQEITAEVLSYAENGVRVEIDVSGIEPGLRGYVLRILGLTLIIVAVMVPVTYAFLSVSLVRPLRALLSNLKAISGQEGDLTARLQTRARDEIGEIADAFNAFVDRICEVVEATKQATRETVKSGERLNESAQESAGHLERISASVSSVKSRIETLDEEIQESASAVNQISASITSLAGSVTNQASSVSDAVAAVEEMNRSINNLVDVANRRKELANALLETAQAGYEKMQESVEAIGSIESSTNEILSAVDVINTIAGQTDLLSMNAAIEAAHAGEAGKGFAVVAEEIRNLAEQTSEHAKSISATLNAEVEKVTFAGESNRAAGESFEGMMADIRQVVDSMGEIVASMNEQSVASSEVLRSLQSIDELSDEVKSASQEIDTSARSVNGNIETVSEVSADVKNEMNEIGTDIGRVNEAMRTITESGRGNAENIERIVREVERFKTE
ncbi:MAG: methyl-accepting chemotaxis protein [Spirochaetaceae bacterium]